MGLYPPEGNSGWTPPARNWRRGDPPWPTVRRLNPCKCSPSARAHLMAVSPEGTKLWICVSCDRVSLRDPSKDNWEEL